MGGYCCALEVKTAGLLARVCVNMQTRMCVCVPGSVRAHSEDTKSLQSPRFRDLLKLRRWD